MTAPPASTSEPVVALLRSGDETPASMLALGRLLGPQALAAVDDAVHEALEAGQAEAADAMLVRTERAARLVGQEAIREWARAGRGFVAASRHDDARARSLLQEAFESLDVPATAQDEMLLRAYCAAGEWLADHALQHERPADARERLGRMLVRAREAPSPDLTPRLLAKLLWLALSTDDLQAARSPAEQLVALKPWTPNEGDRAFREDLLALLQNLASRLYAAGEPEYASARRIAGAVNEAAGPTGPMMFILASTAYALHDPADALGWLDRLLEAPGKWLPGFDVSSLHHRRAMCLVDLKRVPEALAAITQGIKAAPDSPHLRFAAAQIHELGGDDAGAVEQYTHAAELCRQRLATARARRLPRAAPDPIEDLRDMVLMRRALCLRGRGRTAEAQAGLQLLLDEGDEAARRHALVMLAEWADEDGRLQEAADLLQRARPAGDRPPDDEVELLLADVQLRQEHFDEALATLAPLCHKSRRPEQAVALLDRLAKARGEQARVLKWRGHARTEGGWPEQGMQDLDAAIAADPTDPEARLLRALARITFGIQPGQEAWNRSRSMRHVRESLEDLYAALRLSPGHAEVRRVMQWLVERAAANPEMYEIFSAGGSPEGDLFKAFPGLQAAFELAWEANSLGMKREYVQSVQAWTAAKRAYDEIGFTILAESVHLRLADVHLRLLELEKTAAHLERAEKLRFLIEVPLSLDVLERYRQVAAQRGPYEKPTLGREVEYAWFYEHSAFYEIRLAVIKATYRHRIGDHDGALECVELLMPMLDRLEQVLDGYFSVQEVVEIAGVLRSAGRCKDALSLLDRLQRPAARRGASFDVDYARGLVFDVEGRSALAVKAYEKALAAIGKRTAAPGVAPYVQYAASLLNAGRAADAAHALQAIDIEQAATSDRDRLAYHTVAAAVEAERQAHAQALVCVDKALAIAERRRAEIGDLAARRAWQGQQQNLFAIAVRSCVALGRWQDAWRHVEMFKARTLLDELAGRAALSAEHATLVADLETVEQAMRVVERGIEAGTADDAAAWRDVALDGLVQRLKPRFGDVLESPAFVQRDWPALREALHERRERIAQQARQARDTASTAMGTVIGYDALAALIGE